MNFLLKILEHIVIYFYFSEAAKKYILKVQRVHTWMIDIKW